MRPSWDEYFSQILKAVAERSNCCRRKVGCLLVLDNRLIATGYSGTPSGYPNCCEGGCPRCSSKNYESGKNLEKCRCAHSESNAIAQSARYGISTNGAIAYISYFPCLECSKLLINAGIKKVCYLEGYEKDSDKVSEEMLEKCGVEVVCLSLNIKMFKGMEYRNVESTTHG